MSDIYNKNDLLKDISVFTKADERISHWGDTDSFLSNFYEIIQGIKIQGKAPEDVVIGFETSKNTLLYSYLSYRLSAPALLYAFSVLELAITLKGQELQKKFKPHDGLGVKMKYCFSNDLWDIKELAPSTAKPKDWMYYAHNSYTQYYVNYRNNLAHSPKRLDMPLEACDRLKEISSMINMLYK